MVLKVFRGAIIGIMLGVVFGMVVPTAYAVTKVIKENNKLLEEQEQEAQEVFSNNLGNELLRFHIRANSNREEDLQLKYKVRDAILEELQKRLDKDMTKEEITQYINQHLDVIREIALDTVKKEGYGYAVKVYLASDEFPIRQYGDVVLPAGTYDALRVDIGLAEGENFWCILYPMMCYTEESAAIISEEDGKILKEKLSDEEYEKLFVNHEIKDYKIKFKILELLGL